MAKEYNKNFLKREVCEICGNEHFLETIRSVPYSRSELLERLLDRYQGNITSGDLDEACYELQYCSLCKHVFQTYVPTDILAQKIYSYPEGRIEESINKRVQAPLEKVFDSALRVEMMAALLDDHPHKKSILDFGVGWGGFLTIAHAYGFQVTGVDVSDERRAFVNKQGIRAVSSLEELNDETFDFILIDQTLEHLSHPNECLIELSARLKVGGILFIGVPNGNRVYRMLSEQKHDNLFWKVVYPLEHINCFSHHSLIKMAGNAGIQPIQPFQIAKKLFSQMSVFRNAHLAQAALEYMYRYKTTTEMYFVKG